jgi:Mn2+/Fe2+ NRAMP family transporter
MEMTKNMSVALYILVLIAVVVSVDFLFFRNRFWERLMVNIGIVLVFAAFYLRFLKKPYASAATPDGFPAPHRVRRFTLPFRSRVKQRLMYIAGAAPTTRSRR